MNAKQLIIIFILSEISIILVQVDAAQFEGPNVEVPTKAANVSDKKIDQKASIQQNATTPKQTISMTSLGLNVEVASDVYSEKDRQVLYCPMGNYMVVRNRIYLTGPDLDKVKQVKYALHPSFSDPEAVSEDPTNDFEVWIWTWGGFPIKATITTKSGQVFEKDFDFSFKSKFEEAQSKGIPQAMECE
jgi:hypothetical protein